MQQLTDDRESRELGYGVSKFKRFIANKSIIEEKLKNLGVELEVKTDKRFVILFAHDEDLLDEGEDKINECLENLTKPYYIVATKNQLKFLKECPNGQKKLKDIQSQYGCTLEINLDAGQIAARTESETLSVTELKRSLLDNIVTREFSFSSLFETNSDSVFEFWHSLRDQYKNELICTENRPRLEVVGFSTDIERAALTIEDFINKNDMTTERVPLSSDVRELLQVEKFLENGLHGLKVCQLEGSVCVLKGLSTNVETAKALLKDFVSSMKQPQPFRIETLQHFDDALVRELKNFAKSVNCVLKHEGGNSFKATGRSGLHESIKRIKAFVSKDYDSQKLDSISDEAVQKAEELGLKWYKVADGFQVEGRIESLKQLLWFLYNSSVGQASRVNIKELIDMPRKQMIEKFLEMSELDFLTPSYWQHGSNKTLKEAKEQLRRRQTLHHLQPVPESSTLFKAISSLVMKTWQSSLVGQGNDAAGLDPSVNKISIKKIEIIENPNTLMVYLTNRNKVLRTGCKPSFDEEIRRCNDAQLTESLPTIQGSHRDVYNQLLLLHEINEVLLFHGSPSENMEKIMAEGAEVRFVKQGYYGSAFYATDSSTKADQYADMKSRTSGLKHMLVVRTCLGGIKLNLKKGKRYKRPPCRQCDNESCSCGRRDYNTSVIHVGSKQAAAQSHKENTLFREFMLYENGYCYPEFRITYERCS